MHKMQNTFQFPLQKYKVNEDVKNDEQIQLISSKRTSLPATH